MLEYFFPHFYGKFSKNIEVCALIKIISNYWYYYLLIAHSYNSQLKLLTCIFKRGQKAGNVLGDFHSIAEPLRRSWTTTRLFESMVLQKTKSCSRKLQNAMKKTGQGCQTPVYILGGCRCTDFQDNGAVQPLDYGPPKEPRVVQGSYRM